MRITLLLLLAIALTACSGSMGSRAPMGDRSHSPSEVVNRGELPGQMLEWGGVIVDSLNLAESTELQVIAYPLQSNSRPDLDGAPQGRFIAVSPGYLETAEYRKGRQVTLSGKLFGMRQGQVGEAEYLFPLIEPHEIRLWPLEYGSSGRSSIHFGIGAGSRGSGGSIGIGVGF